MNIQTAVQKAQIFLKEKNIKKLDDEDIEPFVDDLYSNNPNKIKKYIMSYKKIT